MKNYLIDSWKKANKMAFVQALLSVIWCVVYTYVITFLTGGEGFVEKHASYETLNGISYTQALVGCGCMMALIPIIMLRFSKLKFACLYVPMSLLYYLALMFICVGFIIDDNFDLIVYAITSVPVGTLSGTIIAILISLFKKIK